MLHELNEKEEAIIVSINCDSDLNQRFYSFGIVKGVNICIENISLAKNTMEINVEDTFIGIRIEEAKGIEVKQI
jgi:Fe2+ transport system protein FeoA